MPSYNPSGLVLGPQLLELASRAKSDLSGYPSPVLYNSVAFPRQSLGSTSPCVSHRVSMATGLASDRKHRGKVPVSRSGL